MKLNLLKAAAGMILLAASVTAKAQKTYTEGVITYTITSTTKGTADSKTYFKGDSSVMTTQAGPAAIKIISKGAGDYLAVLVDVPLANIKKAAVATPAEIEQFQSMLPQLTFTPTTETKQISGFNCKKVTAKDAASNATFDIWVTNDISIPSNGLSQVYSKAGGVPVQFTAKQMGENVSVLLKTVSDDKVPANAFSIPAGFDKISLTELESMAGGNK